MINFSKKNCCKFFAFFIFLLSFLSALKISKADDDTIDYSGNDQHIEIPYNSELNPTGAYTVSAWVKHETNVNDFQSIITSRDDSSGRRGYMLYISNNKHGNDFEFWCGQTTDINGANNFSWKTAHSNVQSTFQSTGTAGWQMVTGTYDGNQTIKIYVNGSLEGTTTSASCDPNDDEPARIAKGSTEFDTPVANRRYFFFGKIDDVAVWDEALSDAEINELYNSGETLYAMENYGEYSSKDNLKAYYTGDTSNDGSGTTLYDAVGTANGTLNNSPVWISNDFPGTSPNITSFTPTDDSTFVDVNTNIVLNFDEIVRGSPTGNIIIKKTSDNSIVETISGSSVQINGSLTNQITINPSVTLDVDTEYYVLVEWGAIVDISNNSDEISSTTEFSFTTNQNPTLTSSNPVDDETGVAPDTNIVLNFSKNVDAESGNISIYKSINGALVEQIDVTSGQISGSGTSQITVNPSSDLEGGVEYYILIDATAFDDSLSQSYAGISNPGDLSFRVLTNTNPLEDKSVTGLLDVQTDISNIMIKHALAPVSNRLKYLRRNKNNVDLTNQNIKINLPVSKNISRIIKAYSDVLPVSTNIEKKILPDKWSSWSEGLYSVTTIGDDGNTNPRRIRTNSFAFGLDKKVNKNQFYGYAVQYGISDSVIDKLGTSADTEHYHLSWYGSKPHSEKNFIEGSLGFGLIESDLIRKKGTNKLTGSRNGGQVFGTINYGRYLSKGNIEVIPRVGLDLGYTELSAYTESGADPLSYSSQFIRSGLATLGLEFNNLNLSLNQKNSFNTFGSIDYGLDFSDTSEAKINYLSDTSTIYTYKGSNNSSHWLDTELGFDYIVKDTLTISSSYNREQGSDDEHSDTVKFRFHFTPESETEYVMQFDVNEDPSAVFNIAKNIYGLNFNFKLDQEFNENLEKNAEISMIKKF